MSDHTGGQSVKNYLRTSFRQSWRGAVSVVDLEGWRRVQDESETDNLKATCDSKGIAIHTTHIERTHDTRHAAGTNSRVLRGF